jgi:hypothetical protein
LDYAREHLKAAYAGVLEQVLLERPGVVVVVVELGEAQAIARELALAGGEVRREMPLYLLGEYRTEARPAGAGGGRTVTVSLRLRRGERDAGAVSSADLSEGEATAFVRGAASDLLARHGAAPGATDTRIDVSAEARELAARAAAFRRLGD